LEAQDASTTPQGQRGSSERVSNSDDFQRYSPCFTENMQLFRALPPFSDTPGVSLHQRISGGDAMAAVGLGRFAYVFPTKGKQMLSKAHSCVTSASGSCFVFFK